MCTTVHCTIQFYTYEYARLCTWYEYILYILLHVPILYIYIIIDILDSDSDAEDGLQLEEMPASTQAEFISETPEVAEPINLSSTGMN